MEHDPLAYGEGVADDYDALYGAVPDTDDAVSRLAELADGGPVLELGVGTGRLALPLNRRGIEVHGIESSEAMVGQLRSKPGGEAIKVTVGDFVETRAGGDYSLVVLALNTIFAPATQDAQVACFRNAAAQLRDGGALVIEAFVLDHSELSRGHAVQPRFVDDEHVELQVLRYEPVDQRIDRVNVHLRNDGVRLVPVRDRYASPSELDLMAQLAGLRLEARWGGWRREPFRGDSAKHVSVYRR